MEKWAFENLAIYFLSLRKGPDDPTFIFLVGPLVAKAWTERFHQESSQWGREKDCLKNIEYL